MSHHIQTTSQIRKTARSLRGRSLHRNDPSYCGRIGPVEAVGPFGRANLRHHPDLTQADLDAAWDYYQCHLKEIDAAIKDDEDA